jgi:N utilization substance protein B
MTRREAREAVFCLLFETEFHKDQTPEEIYALSAENREFDLPENGRQVSYIKSTYFGVLEKLSELDAVISGHSNGWRADRIAPVSRNLLRLCVYEMKYVADVPSAVAIDEAIELVKKFDEEKARAFVNGILNSIKSELEGKTEG